MALGALAGGQDALMEVLMQKLREQQLRNDSRRVSLQERAFDESLKPQAPEPHKPMAVGGRIVDPNTGKVIFEAPPEPKAPRAPIPVAGGSRLFDPDTGKVLLDQVQEPEKPAAPPRPMSVAPGGRLVDPTTGKVIFAAPERSQRPPASATVASAPASPEAVKTEQREQNEVEDAIKLIEQIRNDTARPTATGPIQGRGLGMLQDLEGVTRVKALHDNLVNRMSLAQAGKLKGQGQISNMEREMLQKAATALTLKLGDADYLNELAKVEKQFKRMLTGPRAVNAPAPTAAPGGKETPEQRLKRLLGGG